MRIGIGYDVHRLKTGRDLVLGGVLIPFEKGLLGHSDADVLVHSICDALLGAAGLGDIGLHFPDTDPRYKDVFSINLLKKVGEMIRSGGHDIQNIDATVFAEAPKLAPHREDMVAALAAALDIGTSRVNVKATTTEGLGIMGRGEGMAAMSIALLSERLSPEP